ncbi:MULTISPECIES: hypothetical protein [Sphingobacterium]|uniref:Uncharacterized protein n=1 Tax=Sphingobacterium multivorum TaxID=28454 RepID=A0A2X2JRD3_SPHMU|nr:MULTISPECIES: hypothetical protein [Sphingobacterium]QRQ62986.1 hypothetical protein I6J33_08470 [Sphingobacterium multivorum]SPZ94616.1 Uncharacterised protein [Sphingobacterium multivorum]HAK29612.1 hypothetical protein [Sphingobacterium sp.]
MNQKTNNLLPFELACYEIYDNGYDPLNTIREFWSQNTINDCQESLLALFENYRKGEEQQDAADVKQMHTFLMKVCRVLIAYFLVHFRKIKIDAVPFAFAEPAETIIADLEAKQRIHSFFNRISE